MQNDDEYEGLVVMTQEVHDEFVADGCDPHCHACDKKINVGDQWMLKEFVEKVRTADGFEIGPIRGTCCAQCVTDGRGLSDEETEKLQTRLRAVSKPKPKPKDAWVGPFRGCFVLPDGTRF